MTTGDLKQSPPSGEHRAAGKPDLRRVGLSPDFWYPLAPSRSLRRGTILSATFGGERIALYRAESGRVFALEDRCAHRQVPLHKGIVCGEELRCFYHGWRYHGSGRIASIPTLPDGVRPPIGVRAFPCREAYDHIFVFPGNPRRADDVLLPDLGLASSPRHRTMYFQRRVACHYSFMHENLLDMSHQVMHRGVVGRIKPTLLSYQRGETWVEAKYRFEDGGGRRLLGAEFLSGDGVKSAADSPGDIITIKTVYPYQTLSLAASESAEPVFRLWAVYIPGDPEQKTNHSFGLLMIRKPKLPGLIYLLWPFIRRFAESTFAEDRMAVEAEQRAHDQQGGDWNREVLPLIHELREVLVRNGVSLRP